MLFDVKLFKFKWPHGQVVPILVSADLQNNMSRIDPNGKLVLGGMRQSSDISYHWDLE